jgi:hypothetical protein
MGCVYVTRLSAPLSPSAPLIHFSKFARHSLPREMLVLKVIQLRRSSASAAVPPGGAALSSLLLPVLD